MQGAGPWVDTENRPYVINDLGDVFRGDGYGGWDHLNFYYDNGTSRYDYTAIDIGIDNSRSPGGWNLPVSLNHAGKPWFLIEGSYWDRMQSSKYTYFYAVDVDEQIAYVINFEGYIYKNDFN